MASWTSKENKLFENALQIYTEDTPERWEKLAGALGNTKTAQQVKLHYEKLVEDIMAIERGAIPLPKYKKNPSKSNRMMA
uniref:Uncharacterized protein n=1 Tax=Kalanchoe fedtschenkoi TaxID=63787 RepID=A0A7N0V617_KALFE